MSFLACFVAVTVLSILLRKPIRKAPWAFYILCILFDVVLLSMRTFSLPRAVLPAVSLLMQRGNLAMALFALVMFIGVLPRKGTASHWLRPIRAELSIMASILIAGHMVLYLQTYIPRFMAGSMVKGNVLASFVVALVLLALVLLLGVTSFRFVKRHMKARNWKRLQTLAYPFYALVFVHLMIILLPSAMRGQQVAVVSVAVYCVVFISYLCLRIWRAVIDKRERVDLAETVRDQGFTK